MSDGIAEYYESKRRQAVQLLAEIALAKANGADRETIKRLERQLELARYTGD